MKNCWRSRDKSRSGYSHVSPGSISAVNELTQRLRERGFAIAQKPGFTGDGYYESCFLGAGGNRIEITV